VKASAAITKSQDMLTYCPVCALGLNSDPDECSDCHNARPQTGWPPIDTSPYPWLGKILEGRYVLDQFLGDGATGYVYRARAMQIHRLFAAKIVDTRRYGKPEFEAELVRRFRMEVEAMSRLRNPHVVNIYEAMQIDESIFVVVMDFVDGRTLQDLLERVGRIKLQRALDIIRQVANGLYEAHALGFIHRDLKPDNIMIERLPASGFFAKILDFGIVHMTGGVADTQGFRGTPLYASPEQCLGDPKIDHRSDIYSLGCVFFHLITGQPPFPGTESLQVMESHVHKKPPKVSDVLTRSSISPTVESLIDRMIAKDPNDRPANMSEVIKSIDRLVYESQLEEHTNPTPPLDVLAEKHGGIGRRLETADFPSIGSLAESSVGVSRAVRPVIEFQLPDPVSTEIKAITASSLHRQGGVAVIADQLKRVHMMSLENDGFFVTLEGAKNVITALHIDLKGQTVLAGDLDGEIISWDVTDVAKAEVLPVARKVVNVSDRIFALGLDSRTGRVVAGTERGRVVAYDLQKKTLVDLVSGGPGVSALAVSPTENKVFVGYWGGGLEIIDLHTKKVTKLDSATSNPKSLVISDDGYIAAVLDEKGTVRILSLVQGTTFFEITAEVAHLNCLAFDQSSQLLGMGFHDAAVQLWDIKSQQDLSRG